MSILVQSDPVQLERAYILPSNDSKSLLSPRLVDAWTTFDSALRINFAWSKVAVVGLPEMVLLRSFNVSEQSKGNNRV